MLCCCIFSQWCTSLQAYLENPSGPLHRWTVKKSIKFSPALSVSYRPPLCVCVRLHSYEIIPYWPDLGSSQQIRPGLNFFHVHPFPGSNKEKKCIHLEKKCFLLKWISFEWIYIHILQMFKMRKQLQWQFSVKQLTVWGVKFASVWCCLPSFPVTATNEWTRLCLVAW